MRSCVIDDTIQRRSRKRTRIIGASSSAACKKQQVLLLALLLTTLGQKGYYFSDAFQFPIDYHRSTRSYLYTYYKHNLLGSSTEMHAKNNNKNKNRTGGPRGGGRRGKQKIENNSAQDGNNNNDNVVIAKRVSIPKPSRIRKRIIDLDRKRQYPLRVCSVEVVDAEWWKNSNNPFGAKLWPSALAISEFIVSDLGGNLEEYNVLELGCGVGLVSIVAADCGATVIASDISPTVIYLCKTGWHETQKLRQKQKLRISKRRQQPQQTNDDASDEEEEKDSSVVTPGSLDTLNFDLFSTRPLPISSSSSTNQNILIATTMMYETDLAMVLARRAIEACTCGAWVITGDDDTGEREGGRNLFISEMDRLEKDQGVKFQRIWKSSTVNSKALQWNEKQVKVLHLNAPQDARCLVDDSSTTQG
jgi:SAM-dependent methyltransferase